MIIVPPEADLVARLDPELVPQRLWDDNLTLGADTVSHTYEYNLASRSLLPAPEHRIEAIGQIGWRVAIYVVALQSVQIPLAILPNFV
jgi:hypothetical protein